MTEHDSLRDLRRRVALTGHLDGAGTRTDLRSSLSDDGWRVRIAALRSLHRLGDLSDAELESAMADGRPEVRASAIELAATVASPSLLPALTDPDARVVEVTCWALGERRPVESDTIRHLSHIARQHTDPLCRESAIAALGAIGDRAGLAAVLAGLDDKPAIRRRAVVALAAFDGPDVDEALARARHDHDRQVREAADELLGPA